MNKTTIKKLTGMRDGQNPFDLLGHAFGTGLSSLAKALKVNAVILNILEPKFFEAMRQRIPDLAAAIKLLKKIGIKADQWIKLECLHIEYVDQLRQKHHAAQMLMYDCVMRLQIGLYSHIIHVVLVIGEKPPRVGKLRFSTDQKGRKIAALVVHLNRAVYEGLSEADKNSPLGQIVAMMVCGAEEPGTITRAVRTVCAQRDLFERSFLVELLRAAAYARPSLGEAILTQYNKEAKKMGMQTWQQVLLQDKSMQEAFLASPAHAKAILANEKRTERTSLKKGEARGLKRGEARGLKRGEASGLKKGRAEGRSEGEDLGRKQAHIAALLRVLQNRSIQLSKTHVARLRRLDCYALPSIDLAFAAENARDFAHRAGLSAKVNGNAG